MYAMRAKDALLLPKAAVAVNDRYRAADCFDKEGR